MKNTKVLIAGYLGMFFFGVAFLVMGAVLPSLAAKFSLTEADSSLLVSFLPFGTIFGSLVFGPIIDKYGYKSLMLVAMALGAIGLETIAFGPSTGIVRGGIFILGISGGMLNGATNALVSDASDDKSKAANLSLLGFFYCVGAISLPLLLASLPESVTYSHIVGFAGAMMVATFVYYLFVEFPKAKFQQGFPIKKVLGMAKEPLLLLFSFVLFFQSALEGLSNNWSPQYLATHHGFAADQAQYALSFLVVGMAISRLSLTFILKKVDGVKVIIMSMGLIVAGALCTLFATGTAAAIVGAVLLGMGLAATFPIALGKVGEKYKEMSGTAFSLALVISLFGNTIMNLIIGQVGMQLLPYFQILCAVMIIILFAIGNKKV